jgi:hypothetical protein
VNEIDSFLWLNGIYMSNAIASCLTKHKYPKDPLNSHNEELEQRSKQEKLLMALCAMQKNYELSKLEKEQQ